MEAYRIRKSRKKKLPEILKKEGLESLTLAECNEDNNDTVIHPQETCVNGCQIKVCEI